MEDTEKEIILSALQKQTATGVRPQGFGNISKRPVYKLKIQHLLKRKIFACKKLQCMKNVS